MGLVQGQTVGQPPSRHWQLQPAPSTCRCSTDLTPKCGAQRRSHKPWLPPQVNQKTPNKGAMQTIAIAQPSTLLFWWRVSHCSKSRRNDNLALPLVCGLRLRPAPGLMPPSQSVRAACQDDNFVSVLPTETSMRSLGVRSQARTPRRRVWLGATQNAVQSASWVFRALPIGTPLAAT
jgi:hypothetical protein